MTVAKECAETYVTTLQDRCPPMTGESTRIGYILQLYPSLTMTFIYREVLALEKAGFSIAAFSVWKPARDRLSEEARSLMDSTYYIFPVSWLKFISAHLYFLFTHPAKYIGTALFVMTRQGESWKNRRRTAYHFGEAAYVAKEIQRLRIQHLHAHFEHNAASIALIVSRLLGISFSFTAHNILFTDQILLKEKIREARFVVAISQFTRQYLIRLMPGEKYDDKIQIVHCGVCPADFAPPEPRPVNVVPVLLFVAQLAERKGAPILVEACQLLVEQGVAFQCVIAGDGPQKETVKRLVEQHHLQEFVSLPGAIFQEQLKQYLGQTDIFVLPCITTDDGDMDGVPVVLMEALASEIATVSTNVSGIPELIQDGESGLLVQQKDAVALADALRHLIDDKELRVRLGKNGRRKVLLEFDIDQNAAQLAALIEGHIGSA